MISGEPQPDRVNARSKFIGVVRGCSSTRNEGREIKRVADLEHGCALRDVDGRSGAL
jgi:hypothetical protein